jgi:protein-S-isoprenylcysteine O-methyltransferase Ste14
MSEPTVQVGRRKVAGPWAIVVSVVLLAATAALVIWERPRVGMLISGGIWLAFNVYWSREVRRVAPVQREESARSSARHVWLRQIGLVLLFLPVPGLNAWILPGNLTTVVGLIVQIAGALFYLRAKRELGAAWSGSVSIKVGHQLVKTGPYRWVRHPLYSGMIAMTAGTAIVCNQIHAAIGLVLMIVAYWIKIGVEERWMREEFGAAWDEYRRTTRALIPGVL